MKSKVIIIICAMLTAACAGSDDDGGTTTAERAVVEFGTDVVDTWHDHGAATRAPIEGLNGLKSLADGFGVFAYFTDDEDWTTAKATALPDMMLNQPVVWDGETEQWTYTPPKYWPNSTDNATPRRISFFAYAPHTETVSATSGITGLPDGDDPSPHVNYALDYSPATVLDLPDLLYADPVVDATRNGHGLVVVGDDSHEYQKVPLNFHHALASMAIYVQRDYDEPTQTGKKPDSEEHTKLFVNTLKLIPVVSGEPVTTGTMQATGTLNLETGEWQDATSTVAPITLTNPNGQYVLDEAVSGTAETDPDIISSYELEKWENVKQNENENQNDYSYGVTEELRPLLGGGRVLMFMPQTLTFTPVLSYSMVTRDNALELGYIEDDQKNRYLRILHNDRTGNQLTITFEKGKRYTLVIHIGVETVRFEVVSVEDWDFPLRFTTTVTSYDEDNATEKILNEDD